MSAGLRVAIASSGPAEFQALHEAITSIGHIPVAYLISRSLRPGTASEPDILRTTKSVLDSIPPDMDLLLPGGPHAVRDMLSGYSPDVLLVFCFNWRLPREVLDLPRIAAVNIHPAPLPKYRGPSPVLHAIRNGDPYLGLTIHRMTERLDAGPVLAQVTDIPMPEHPTRAGVWEFQKQALPALITTALDRAVDGDQGTPQDESATTYAYFPPREWLSVSWQGSRRDIHNQIRFLRYVWDKPPTVTFQGRALYAERSSLTADGTTLVDCADGPLWVKFTPAPSG